MKEKLPKKRHLLWAGSLSFYLGIWVGTTVTIPPLWYFYLGIAVVATLWALFPRYGILYCICCALLIGFLFPAHARTALAEHPLYQYTDTPIHFRGIICDGLDARSNHIKITLCITHLHEHAEPLAIPGKVLASVSLYESLEYGAMVDGYGTLEIPFTTEEFSYNHFLLKEGITHTLTRPQLTLLSTGHGHPVWEFTFALRDWFEESINHLWHEPHASFLAGLLIGSRKGIPDVVMDAFQRTGLTHIIAISGYNITLLIVIISGLLGVFSRPIQVTVSIIVIILFTMLVGGSSAVVRAAIMGILSLLALLFHQKNTIALTVVVSGMLMLCFKPLTLVYDVGFQLSFLAVFGLIFIGPHLQRWAQVLPDTLGLKEAFLMTISATITTTPAILYHFGLFSFVSPITNVLVSPFVPLAMLWGFTGLLFSFLLPPLAQLSQVLASWCLEAVIQVALLFDSLPWAAGTFGRPSGLAVFFSYGAMAFILWLLPPPNNDTAFPPESSPHDTPVPKGLPAPSDG